MLSVKILFKIYPSPFCKNMTMMYKTEKGKDRTKILEKEQRVAAMKRKFQSLKLDQTLFE